MRSGKRNRRLFFSYGLAVLLAAGVVLTGGTANLEAIADLAIARKIGARGLRMIIEDLMLDLMYNLPSMKKVKDGEDTDRLHNIEASQKERMLEVEEELGNHFTGGFQPGVGRPGLEKRLDICRNFRAYSHSSTSATDCSLSSGSLASIMFRSAWNSARRAGNNGMGERACL